MDFSQGVGFRTLYTEIQTGIQTTHHPPDALLVLTHSRACVPAVRASFFNSRFLLDTEEIVRTAQQPRRGDLRELAGFVPVNGEIF